MSPNPITIDVEPLEIVCATCPTVIETVLGCGALRNAKPKRCAGVCVPCQVRAGLRAAPLADRLAQTIPAPLFPVYCQECESKCGETTVEGSTGLCDPCLDARYPA